MLFRFHGFDVVAMAHNAGIVQKPLEVARGVPRDAVEIKAVKCRTEMLALGEDGAPTQAGLKTFQTDFPEKLLIIHDREAPFVVVMGDLFRCGAAPAAAKFAVVANGQRG
mgnify:CR=1 FL=1